MVGYWGPATAARLSCHRHGCQLPPDSPVGRNSDRSSAVRSRGCGCRWGRGPPRVGRRPRKGGSIRQPRNVRVAHVRALVNRDHGMSFRHKGMRDPATPTPEFEDHRSGRHRTGDDVRLTTGRQQPVKPNRTSVRRDRPTIGGEPFPSGLIRCWLPSTPGACHPIVLSYRISVTKVHVLDVLPGCPLGQWMDRAQRWIPDLEFLPFWLARLRLRPLRKSIFTFHGIWWNVPSGAH